MSAHVIPWPETEPVLDFEAFTAAIDEGMLLLGCRKPGFLELLPPPEMPYPMSVSAQQLDRAFRAHLPALVAIMEAILDAEERAHVAFDAKATDAQRLAHILSSRRVRIELSEDWSLEVSASDRLDDVIDFIRSQFDVIGCVFAATMRFAAVARIVEAREAMLQGNATRKPRRKRGRR